MPGGVPVATVALDGAKNAGVLAAQILGTGDDEIQRRVTDYKSMLRDHVMDKVEKLSDNGYESYTKLD